MKTVLSLFDESGVMVAPWASAGYKCIMVDCSHLGGVTRYDNSPFVRVGGDIRSLEWRLKRLKDVVFVAAFPPCTDLAVSGARWFEKKRRRNPYFQKEALELVYIAKEIAETHGCPYMIENPVSVISTMWRKPDYTFHPYEYSGYWRDDNYTKKTCLWTGNGFVMPPKFYDKDIEIDNRIHWMPPSQERARIRSTTPMGFAQAVFLSNSTQGV